MLVEGETIFKTFLTEHDTYQGQSTGKYSLQIKLDGATASRLTKEGVVIKEYEGEPIRKFTSRYDVPVYISKTEKWEEELPSGTLIVSCSRHITVVINGVLHDTYDCSRNGTRCVYGYWSIQ